MWPKSLSCVGGNLEAKSRACSTKAYQGKRNFNRRNLTALALIGIEMRVTPCAWLCAFGMSFAAYCRNSGAIGGDTLASAASAVAHHRQAR